MSILSVRKTAATEGDDNSLTVRYKVRTTGTETVVSILASSDVPQKGERLSSGSPLVCLRRRVACQSDTDDDLWELEVEYGSRDDLPGGGTVTGDAARIEGLSFSPRYYDRVAEEGYLADATTMTTIMNSAGDPFDPPVMMQVANVVMHLSQREVAGYSPSLALTYLHSINSVAVTVAGFAIPAKKGMIVRCDPQMQTDRTYVTSYDIELATAVPFATRLLDQGYRYLDGNGKPREIRLSDINTEYASGNSLADQDKFVSDPVKLDGSGGVLTSDGTPAYREYRINEMKNWNTGLNLAKRSK